MRNLPDKYRPQTFEQVIGAEDAVSVLSSIVKKKHPPTAILLTGPSGVGKTTLSRLISKYLNCESQSACGECASCLSHATGQHPDLTEVNAADTRGIDDVRALASGARFSAVYRVKVIYLDECHQLTPQAQQSLLKHLEEPPPATVFVLSTTNPEKLPAAMVGRCLRVPLSYIGFEPMVKRLAQIAKKEGVDLKSDPEKAKSLIHSIAHLSNGQMRDALQLLQTAIMTGGKDLGRMAREFSRTMDVSVEQAAVKVLLNVYNRNLSSALKGVYDKEDAVRGLMTKMRWANDKLLRQTLGIKVPFYDMTFRELTRVLKQKSLVPSIEQMCLITKELNVAESRMNTSMPELMVMLEAVSNCVTHNAQAQAKTKH